MIFALAMDPHIRFLARQQKITNNLVIGFCADDVAAVFETIADVRIFVTFFRYLCIFSNLRLNIGKTVFSPLGAGDFGALCNEVSSWIQAVVPAWSEIVVRDAVEYLGFWIGRSAYKYLWKKPWANFLNKVETNVTSNMPAVAALAAYAKRALPTLLYVGQLVPPTKQMISAERGILAKILGVPHNSFSSSAFHDLVKWGGGGLSIK